MFGSFCGEAYIYMRNCSFTCRKPEYTKVCKQMNQQSSHKKEDWQQYGVMDNSNLKRKILTSIIIEINSF